MQQRLNFLPEPQGQGALREIFAWSRVWVSVWPMGLNGLAEPSLLRNCPLEFLFSA